MNKESKKSNKKFSKLHSKNKLNRSINDGKLITIIEKNVLGKYGYNNIKELTQLKRHI